VIGQVGEARAARPTRIDPADLLTPAQVQRIRLEEIRSSDRVGIAFANNALRRYLAQRQAEGEFNSRQAEQEFLRAPRIQQVVHMLSKLDPNDPLKRDILIEGDPRAIGFFRTSVWPMVRQHCATPQCHGQPGGAGGLKLFRLNSDSNRVLYTNFYILDTYANSQGKMVDRGQPLQSLLLQYGLPDEQAQSRHPEVDLPPIFRSPQDPLFRSIVQWIRDDLLYPRSAYRLDYTPPSQRQPATQPQQGDGQGG
jgi:hypothetical protein